MPQPYPQEFRDDVVRVALTRNRKRRSPRSLTISASTMLPCYTPLHSTCATESHFYTLDSRDSSVHGNVLVNHDPTVVGVHG